MLGFSSSRSDTQKSFRSDLKVIDAPSAGEKDHPYEYGIGIDLFGIFGTVVAAFANGTKVNIARIEGDETFKNLFKNLSTESYQHIHPLYESWDDLENDWPRQRQRQDNKKHGLPASKDVETLSTMIVSLLKAAQSRLGHDIHQLLHRHRI